MTRAFCVCVPARDEAERLPILLHALAAQTVTAPVPVSLCVNNSRDGSADVARRVADALGYRLALTIVERDYPPDLAHVGSARGCAMDMGADLLGDDRAVLISTDADCRPPRDWIAAILAAIEDDRIVGGRIAIDEAEPLRAEQFAIRARLDRYWEEVRALEDAIDPLPWDAPPRHGDHTGASLAMTVGLYRSAGGVPPIACGEDRALVENARAVGGRLVHPPAVWTRASPRADGRAPGGMAETMATLGRDVPMVPAFEHWRRRAEWRRATRVRGEAALVEAERLLPPMACDMALPGASR